MLKVLLEQGISDGAFPGAAYAIGTPDRVEYGFAGRLTYSPEAPVVTEETLWDLASVTKVVSTTSSAMLLYQQGKLDLEAHATSYVSRFRHDQVTIRQLLTHSSGLPAYCSFQLKNETPEQAENELFSLNLRPAVPPKMEYSCMGFMIMQRVIESISGVKLDQFVRENVHGPLGMKDTMYNPSLTDRTRCAVEEKYDDWRKKIEDKRGFVRVNEEFIQGTVHDPAAFMMGGVSGNAGLFSNPHDLGNWMHELIRGGDKVYKPEVLKEWIKRQSQISTRALGFDTKSEKGSSAGRRFSLTSFGHTGYTGTTVWMDPTNKFFACLLTNRVHPTSENSKITEFRPKFHDAVWDRLKGRRVVGTGFTL